MPIATPLLAVPWSAAMTAGAPATKMVHSCGFCMYTARRSADDSSEAVRPFHASMTMGLKSTMTGRPCSFAQRSAPARFTRPRWYLLLHATVALFQVGSASTSSAVSTWSDANTRGVTAIFSRISSSTADHSSAWHCTCCTAQSLWRAARERLAGNDTAPRVKAKPRGGGRRASARPTRSAAWVVGCALTRGGCRAIPGE